MFSFSVLLRLAALLLGCAGPWQAVQAAEAGSTPSDRVVTRPFDDRQPGPRADCSIDRFEARFLDLINRMRAVGASCGASGEFGPTGPLRWNAQLTQAARSHVLEMAATHHFHHTSLRSGQTVAQRIAAAGYAWGEYGENLSAGGSSPEEIVARWHRSPRHCANLMNPAFTDVGAACMAAEQPIRYRTFWTLDLAGP